MTTEERVTVDPEVMAGKPVIKGTRIPVYVILEMLGEGKTMAEIIEVYPDLEEEDVKAAINYVTKRVQREAYSEESVA